MTAYDQGQLGSASAIGEIHASATPADGRDWHEWLATSTDPEAVECRKILADFHARWAAWPIGPFARHPQPPKVERRRRPDPAKARDARKAKRTRKGEV